MTRKSHQCGPLPSDCNVHLRRLGVLPGSEHAARLGAHYEGWSNVHFFRANMRAEYAAMCAVSDQETGFRHVLTKLAVFCKPLAVFDS